MHYVSREKALDMLRGGPDGVNAWNKYRREHPEPVAKEAFAEWKHRNPEVLPDLSGADLEGADLSGGYFRQMEFNSANLRKTILYDTHFGGAKLVKADLRGSHPSGSIFTGADLTGAKLDRLDLSGADFANAVLRNVDLSNAGLYGAVLSGADLSGSNLRNAELRHAMLVETNLSNSDISGCSIYGVSAWNLKLSGTKQANLDLREERWHNSTLTVDDIEIAQFIYLLLNNERIRKVIDTITSKVVLILGRFNHRKTVLEAIREELRRRGYVPILFDFNKPDSRDFIETVSTLAHLARFVIADFTDARIVLEEVPHIVRNVVVPVKPLLIKDAGPEPTTLYNLRRNHSSLLSTLIYTDLHHLLGQLHNEVIVPCEQCAKQLKS
jgi:uncharacterized protein YjbI with pentapeptide repeats